MHKHSCTLSSKYFSEAVDYLLLVLVQDVFALNQNEALQNFDVVCLSHKLYEFYQLRKKKPLQKYKKD